MRRNVKNKAERIPDHKYDSEKVTQLINYIMWSGKKQTAQEIVYGAFDTIKQKTKKDPLAVFEEALKNAGPLMEVRSRRIGGANYQVPREVRPERRISLALRWIIGAARNVKSGTMRERLAQELIAASKGEGAAVKKKEDTHKMAEANRAFAHFAW